MYVDYNGLKCAIHSVIPIAKQQVMQHYSVFYIPLKESSPLKLSNEP